MHEAFVVAFGMNGLVLPRSHGFPVRLNVPGRFGMKNVKWVDEIMLTGEEQKGYWVVRGWDHDAIVRTQARFDVPKHRSVVRSPLEAAGVAWAGDRGISAVEVSTDDGRTWEAARLEGQTGPQTWQRWRIRVRLPAGTHSLTCRATDGRGTVQEARRTPPHPSGATGYHRIDVTVEASE